jgi:lysophospholipase L1-like esterase
MSNEKAAAVDPAARLSRRKKLLFAAVAVLVPFVLLEAAARLWLAVSDATLQAEIAGGAIQTNWLHNLYVELASGDRSAKLYEPDLELFWKLRPNTKLPVANEVFVTRGKPLEWELRTNAEGFRGPQYPSPASGPVVACFGDSCTFGYRVNDAETYPARLQQYLREHRRAGATVLNYGVPGYTTFQGRRLLEQVLAHRRPDVVILAFGGNDHEVDEQPDSVKAKRLTAFRLKVARLLDYSALAQMAVRLGRTLRRAEPDSTSPLPPRVAPAEFDRNLRAMAQAAQSAGAQVILLDLVFVAPIHRNTIAGVARDMSVPWIDGRQVLRDALPEIQDGRRFRQERDRWDRFWKEQFVGRRDPYFSPQFYRKLFADPSWRLLLRYLMVEPVHPNALGHRLLAEAVGEVILAERD